MHKLIEKLKYILQWFPTEKNSSVGKNLNTIQKVITQIKLIQMVCSPNILKI